MCTVIADVPCVVQRLSRTLIQLNIATRLHHASADAPWLDLMVPTIGKTQYVKHLIKVYGFEASLEAAFRYTPGLSTLVDLRTRTRSGLLAQDLMRLGLGPARIAELPQRFAMFAGAGEALGWMYVIERSTLLHGGVRRQLTLRVPDISNAMSYLSAYDGVAGRRWSDFGCALETVAHSPSAAAQIVRAANHGFCAMRDWFRDGETLRSVAT